MIRAAIFLALVLFFPCPWYMIAVGGLLPLPVIASYGAAGGSVLAFSVVHVVVYTWIFYLLARWIGSLARRAHLRGLVPAVLILAIAFGVGAAPIYGSGESLLGGHKLRYSAYKVYREAYRDWASSRRRPAYRVTEPGFRPFASRTGTAPGPVVRSNCGASSSFS